MTEIESDMVDGQIGRLTKLRFMPEPQAQQPISVAGPWTTGFYTFTRRKAETPMAFQLRIEAAATVVLVRVPPVQSPF